LGKGLFGESLSKWQRADLPCKKMKDNKIDYFFWTITIVFIFITSFINVYGYFNAPDDKLYYITSGDVNVYFSYLDQAREGNFLFYNQFTSESHPNLLFFPLWFLGGQAAGILHLSNTIIYVLLKIILTFFLLYLLYRLLSYLLKDVLWSRVAWLFAIFTGGSFAWGNLNDLLNICYSNSLVVLSLIIILVIFWQIILYCQSNKSFHLIITAILSLLLTLIHPYDAILLFLVTGLLLVFSACRGYFYFKRYLILAVLIFSGIGLGYLYYLYLFSHFTAFRGWFFQNFLEYEGVWWFIKAYGPSFLLALSGLALLIKEKRFDSKLYLMVSWLIAIIILLFLPIFVSAKLFIGVSAPMSVFGGYTIIKAMNVMKNFILKTFLIMFIIIMLSLVNYSYFTLEFINLKNQTAFHYLPSQYVKPIRWLKENLTLQEVVLTSEKWNTFLGGYCACRVFIGGNQTNQANYKTALVNWFYRDNLQDSEKQKFLQEYNIDYVYHSPAEKEKGDFNPQSKNYLIEVYDDGWAQIYRVKK